MSRLTLADRPCACGKPPAFDLGELTDGAHCTCCLGDDCSAPAVWRVVDLGSDDVGEHYCSGCVAAYEVGESESRPLGGARLVEHVHSPAAVRGTNDAWQWQLGPEGLLGGAR